MKRTPSGDREEGGRGKKVCNIASSNMVPVLASPVMETDPVIP